MLLVAVTTTLGLFRLDVPGVYNILLLAAYIPGYM